MVPRDGTDICLQLGKEIADLFVTRDVTIGEQRAALAIAEALIPVNAAAHANSRRHEEDTLREIREIADRDRSIGESLTALRRGTERPSGTS